MTAGSLHLQAPRGGASERISATTRALILTQKGV